MDFFDALHTSSSGLTAQRLRMNLISSNLANIHTTRTPKGGPYKRKDAIFEARPVAESFKDVLRSRGAKGVSEVKVAEIIEDPAPPIMKYDPKHPDADEKGYVAMPNINLMEEMVNMITAARSYEANVAAVKASKSMALKALDIGK
jgi:flagellar basal-body rod protein FlgC